MATIKADTLCHMANYKTTFSYTDTSKKIKGAPAAFFAEDLN